MSATLYLRNVPDDVIRRLQMLAEVTGASVSATAVAELAEVTRRADNASVLATLPDLRLPPDRIVRDLETARPDR